MHLPFSFIGNFIFLLLQFDVLLIQNVILFLQVHIEHFGQASNILILWPVQNLVEQIQLFFLLLPTKSNLRFIYTCMGTVWGLCRVLWPFALHTSHFTLHTSHFALRTSHFTLRTSPFTLRTSHCTLRTSHFTLHPSHFTLHTRALEAAERVWEAHRIADLDLERVLEQ